MSNQLIKETALGREQVFPKNYILNLKDKDSGTNLEDILKSFNMLFLSYLGNKPDTRKQVPMSLRHGGLWITYIVNSTVVTEWYDSTAIDDYAWGSDSYWREGSNMLVGDISISKQGTWVINGEDTGISPKGDKGDSPVIRIYNNRIQVSYDEGNTYIDLNNTPVFTLFRFNSNTNTHLVSYDLGLTWQDVLPDKVYYKFRYNQSTNTYLVSTDLGKTWSNVSAEKVFYKFRFNPTTNTHQVSTDLGSNWVDISTEKVFYKFRTNENKLQVSTDLGTTWKDCSELIAAWFRWANGDTADSVGKILISRDEQKTWTDLSPNIVNNLRIKGYVAAVGNLPSDAALGDIYMVGPTYDESDTTHDYPHYRMWVKLSSGWVDNGEYLSNVLVSQEFGNNSGAVISLKFITEQFRLLEKSLLRNQKLKSTYPNVPQYSLGPIPTKYGDSIKIVYPYAAPSDLRVNFYDKDGNYLDYYSGNNPSGTRDFTNDIQGSAYCELQYNIENINAVSITINGGEPISPSQILFFDEDNNYLPIVKRITEFCETPISHVEHYGGYRITTDDNDDLIRQSVPSSCCVRLDITKIKKNLFISKFDPISDYYRVWFFDANKHLTKGYNRNVGGSLTILASDIPDTTVEGYLDVPVSMIDEITIQYNKPDDINHPDKQILEQYNKSIRNLRTGAIIGEPLVLLHFSDIHGGDANLQNIVTFYKEHSGLIDDIIHTGDALPMHWQQSFDFWSEYGLNTILNVIGNHDTAYYTKEEGFDWTRYVGKAAYDRYFAPFISQWGVVQPANASSLGLCYYYKDYSNGIRLIVIDDMSARKDGDTAQLTWFRNVLSNAVSGNKHVIVAGHISNQVTPIESSFHCIGSEKTIETYSSREEYISAVDQFITNGGVFVAWITGHQHQDVLGIVKNTNNPQLNIGISTSNYSQAVFDNINRRIDDKSANLFNVLKIDPYNKRLSVHRVGSDYDSDGRRIDIICYDYNNNELVR